MPNLSLSLAHASALHHIARAGWLTTSDIAALLYPDKVSAPQLARRALNSLFEQKLVSRTSVHGAGHVYAITRKGCDAVSSELGETVEPTLKLLDSLGNFRHRCAANRAVIRHIMSPGRCSHLWEHEIQTGKALIYQPSERGKLPDYLIVTEQGVLWGEVERSKRSSKDRKALVDWLLDLLWLPVDTLPELSPGVYLRQVEFIAVSFFETELHRWTVSALIDRGLGEGQAEHVAHDLLGYYTIVRQL